MNELELAKALSYKEGAAAEQERILKIIEPFMWQALKHRTKRADCEALWTSIIGEDKTNG
jgi:hypothetical protein